MNREKVIEFLGQDWVRMSELMRDALGSDIGLLNSTNASILSNPGKMLRPALSLLIARACGETNDDSSRYAAAVEILHNATLLHDDVADESSERRGFPTVNSLLGPQSAVLVGDFWLAKTMELMLGSQRRDENVVRLFGQTLVDLAEGEMFQLEKASSADTAEADYFHIIYCKTASLFVTACVSAATTVDAPQEYVDAAQSYAKAAGIAFQIKDDILDYVGDPQLGKPLGIDLRERKITLPLLCALQGSEREEEIRGMVKEIPEHPEYVEEIAEFVRQRGGVAKATARLNRFIDDAVAALDVFPDSTAKDYLAQLARFIALREV